MKTAKFIAVEVDTENSATTWWDCLNGTYPLIAKSLRDNDVAVITDDVWDDLALLDGFEDGPNYAPTALLYFGSEGEPGWSDVVSRRHSVFETAE